MKLYVAFTVLLAVAVGVSSQKEGCFVPPEWEATVQAYDFLTAYYARGKIAHDAREERIFFIEEEMENRTENAYSNLYLYKEHVQYRVDLKTRQCSKHTLHGEFPHKEIYPNAEYMGEVKVGTLDKIGAGVILQSWRIKTMNGVSFQTVTMECVPVEFQFIGGHGGTTIQYQRLYYDVTPGIRDRAIFEVPKECL